MKKRYYVMLLILCIFVAMPFANVQGISNKKANEQGKNLANSWSSSGYNANGCLVGNTLYYNVYNKLYTMNVKTGKKKLLYRYDCFSIDSIQYYNKRLYVVINKFEGTAGFYPYITSLKKNGTDYKLLTAGCSVSISGGKIYYIKQTVLTDFETFDPVGAYSMNPNGKKKKRIIKNDIMTRVVCDGKKIYYSTLLGTYQISLKGKSKKKIAGKEEEVLGVYNNTIYYKLRNENSEKYDLYQRDMNGRSTRWLDSAEEINSARIDVSKGELYYIKASGGGKANTLIKRNLKTYVTSTVLQQKELSSVFLFGKYIMYSFHDGKNMQTKFFTTSTKKRKHLAKYYVS